MNLCKTCIHAMPVEATQLIRCGIGCGYQVTAWIPKELRAAGARSGLAVIDCTNADYGKHYCPTYQPREEK